VTWLFDPGTGRLTGTLPAQAGSPVSVAFSPDGATLAVAMVEETGPDKVSLWNVASRTLIRTVSDPRGEINSVAYSPSGAAIAVADVPGATVFDAATGQVIAALTDPPHRRDQPGSGNFPPSFGQAAFSPSGSMLAVTDGRGDVYVWDVATRRVIKTLTAPGQGGTTSADMVAFSPSGTMLATDGGPGAYVWDLATGQVSAELRDPGRGVSAMSFSPDSKTLGASDVDGMIYLWHTQT
jgi:WD40 repeat protein